jgi:hypothetical protein
LTRFLDANLCPLRSNALLIAQLECCRRSDECRKFCQFLDDRSPAELLKSENIPVSLVVTIDPAHASPKVPLNVERYINIFLSDSVLGGGDVVAEQGYKGHYASFDLKEHEKVTYINIDKMDSIHQQLVTAIAQLATTPLPAKGEAVPLRYVVPSDAPLELWDSGTQQLARSGDTLQRLTALNRVPLCLPRPISIRRVHSYQ